MDIFTISNCSYLSVECLVYNDMKYEWKIKVIVSSTVWVCAYTKGDIDCSTQSLGTGLYFKQKHYAPKRSGN